MIFDSTLLGAFANLRKSIFSIVMSAYLSVLLSFCVHWTTLLSLDRFS